MYSTSANAAVTLLCFASSVYAAVARTCPQSDVCYQLNIPDDTASSGSGDIYFQLSAPTSYSWVALGQGSQMAGSNIFVMYTSADGNNVTISPRLGTGHVQPQHDTSAQIAVLEGSTVSGGMMTANVRCSNCGSWQGGSMDFSGSNSDWIYAYKSGSALNSDALDEGIRQHGGYDNFNWDLSQARGGSNANPFVSADGSTATSPTSGGGATSSASATSESDAFSDLSQQQQDNMLTAHAVCACLAFVALFPIGGILIRIASFTGLVWIHAAIQMLGYVIFVVAFGLGLFLAVNGGYLTEAHPIIGLVLFIVLFFQPLLGWVHHRMFKKYSQRTGWSWAHLGIGRFAIILGIVNGGLGLQLASADSGEIIAYAVIAGLVGVVYFAVVVFGEVRRSRRVNSVPPTHGESQKDLHHMQSLNGDGAARQEDVSPEYYGRGGN